MGYLIYSIFIGLIGIACTVNTLRFKFKENIRKEIMDHTIAGGSSGINHH